MGFPSPNIPLLLATSSRFLRRIVFRIRSPPLVESTVWTLMDIGTHYTKMVRLRVKTSGYFTSSTTTIPIPTTTKILRNLNCTLYKHRWRKTFENFQEDQSDYPPLCPPGGNGKVMVHFRKLRSRWRVKDNHTFDEKSLLLCIYLVRQVSTEIEEIRTVVDSTTVDSTNPRKTLAKKYTYDTGLINTGMF